VPCYTVLEGDGAQDTGVGPGVGSGRSRRMGLKERRSGALAARPGNRAGAALLRVSTGSPFS
jgi:hypothetical protein